MGVVQAFYSGLGPILLKQIPYTMAKFGVQQQPADGLLSKINKKGAGGEGGMFTRLGRIAAETGFKKLCLEGLPARWVHVGTITAGQFAIVDAVMMGVGAKRFHFHKPAAASSK